MVFAQINVFRILINKMVLAFLAHLIVNNVKNLHSFVLNVIKENYFIIIFVYLSVPLDFINFHHLLSVKNVIAIASVVKIELTFV